MTIRSGKIILFDGVCNLCNSAVRFVLKRDRKKQFSFAALQSSAGQELLGHFIHPEGKLYSFFLIEDGNLYGKSTAALKVLKDLGPGWYLLYSFIIIPKFFRDWIYDLISKNRYRWFGRKEKCMTPDESIKKWFLE
jgi:predicted DCC family thiol-disulfide oxidoreductase YuxK